MSKTDKVFSHFEGTRGEKKTNISHPSSCPRKGTRTLRTQAGATPTVMIMMAKTTKPTMKLITNEEGGEGETGGKTTQVRERHKLRSHCLFDLGFCLFGHLARSS